MSTKGVICVEVAAQWRKRHGPNWRGWLRRGNGKGYGEGKGTG